ncbi:MAG: Galactofuranosyltransferase 2 N-terminal, partial [Actinomycetota bacterium]
MAGVIDSAGLRLPKDDRATFDTAFGVFAAGRWSRLTSIADIVATMNVSGRALVELIAYANGVDTVIASSDEGQAVSCDDIRGVSAESFYVAVTALEDGVVVHGGEWGTTTAPTRNVQLGVAITTF